MKAIVCTAYGSPDVLRLEEIAKPTPKASEVLVKVYASSVNAADWRILRADPFLVRLAFGLFRPKIEVLGLDIAGVVEAVGAEVTRFTAGDTVFGDISSCGFGGFAEFACAAQDALALKPSNLSFEEAAAVPAAAVTALQAIRDKGKVRPGQRVLIVGASGGVGTFAVQLAKQFGAEVTAVCSTRNLERARSLGADHVLDYTVEDFTRSGHVYDVVLAMNGYRSIFDSRRALAPGGTYVSSGGNTRQVLESVLIGPLLSLVDSRRFGNLLANPDGSDLAFVGELLASGEVAPVIDRVFSLEEVPDAIRYLEEGRAQGKVVVSVPPRDQH